VVEGLLGMWGLVMFMLAIGVITFLYAPVVGCVPRIGYVELLVY
jgi:hypothetical protein